MISTPTQPVTLVSRSDPEELDAVMAIMDKAFDPRFGEGWTRSQCAGILPMAGVALTIARSPEGAPLGFALSRTVAGESELLLLAVAPEHRRRGVGGQLLDDFVSSALRNGATRVHLEVRDGNPAIAMYEAAGFEVAGRRRKYYRGRDGDQFDALTYVRKL